MMPRRPVENQATLAAVRADVGLLAESGVFDRSWYLRRYPEVRSADLDPLLHFCRVGWHLGHDPNQYFSTDWYLREYPDLSSGINPIAHYLELGWREGRRFGPDDHRSGALPTSTDLSPLALRVLERCSPEPSVQVPANETHMSCAIELAMTAARPSGFPVSAPPLEIVAFYLPQFHQIPENDQWWGEGFTEWSNVRRGRPRFPGHYQPHVPGELGYYDLLDPAVLQRQVELATLHGITAFCFYTYWFNGKRLLEKPVDTFLADASLDLKFCVCWANENWTRTWDGNNRDVLIGQSHSAQDDIAFISEISQYLRDPRYLRVAGKPVLLLYRPSLLPDPRASVARWRTWCAENGVGEILLAYVQSFDTGDPAQFGFDVAIEFPPNAMAPREITELVLSSDFNGRMYRWADLVTKAERFEPPDYRLWRGVCPSWDNEARRPGRGTVLTGATPAEFQRWLRIVGEQTIDSHPPGERFVFVNAWNEWAEGCHLEPDTRFGYQWLHAVRRAQQGLAGGQASWSSR